MKLRTALASAALGVAAIVGLTACSPGATSASSMSPEATALTALGFTDSDVTPAGSTGTLGESDPSAAPTATPGKHDKHPLLRRLAIRRALGRNVLHGEVTVATKDGDKVIEVQRGVVTAITGTTVTVKSTDGFVVTWTFGTPIHVVEHRTTVQPTDLAVGTTIGVAGTKDGTTDTARLIVIPNPAKTTK
jgi:hypothetical protein